MLCSKISEKHVTYKEERDVPSSRKMYQAHLDNAIWPAVYGYNNVAQSNSLPPGWKMAAIKNTWDLDR